MAMAPGLRPSAVPARVMGEGEPERGTGGSGVVVRVQEPTERAAEQVDAALLQPEEIGAERREHEVPARQGRG